MHGIISQLNPQMDVMVAINLMWSVPATVLRVDNILKIKGKRSWRATEVLRLRSMIKMQNMCFQKKIYGQDFDHMQYI